MFKSNTTGLETPLNYIYIYIYIYIKLDTTTNNNNNNNNNKFYKSALALRWLVLILAGQSIEV